MNKQQPADWQDRMLLYYDSEIAQMYRRKIERLELRIIELETALRPLVDACEVDFETPDCQDDESVGGGVGKDSEMTLTFGAIRRGRRAISAHPEHKGEPLTPAALGIHTGCTGD